jgi:hypothetical protein
MNEAPHRIRLIHSHNEIDKEFAQIGFGEDEWKNVLHPSYLEKVIERLGKSFGCNLSNNNVTDKSKGTWTSPDGKSYPTKHGIVDLSLMESLATDSNGETNKGEN